MEQQATSNSGILDKFSKVGLIRSCFLMGRVKKKKARSRRKD